ncbi:MAG: hypothetical protein WCW55_03250 [Patescibacteria group bacterium]
MNLLAQITAWVVKAWNNFWNNYCKASPGKFRIIYAMAYPEFAYLGGHGSTGMHSLEEDTLSDAITVCEGIAMEGGYGMTVFDDKGNQVYPSEP